MIDVNSASFYVRRVQTVEEYQSCQQVHRRVWGFGPEDTVMHLPMMVALQHYGGLVLGAFTTTPTGEELIGFVVGFIGRDEQSGEYFHYSQVAAALSEWQSRGVGLALKAAQRREAMVQGYNLMRWAYDPLEGRNAYFNLAKLGGISRHYILNMYGAGRGELFGSLDTDRLIVDWELPTTRVTERITLAETNQKPNLPIDDYAVLPCLIEVEWLDAYAPKVREIDLSRRETALLLEIPYSNKLVQKLDPQAGVSWRNHTRTLFKHYMAAGYFVADFFTQPGEHGARSFYVLKQGL